MVELSKAQWMLRAAVALVLVAIAASVVDAATASWDPNSEPDLAGYKLSYGTQSGVHTTTIDVGKVTTYQFYPAPGRYYVVVQAYNTAGVLGEKSAEAMIDIGLANRENSTPTLTQPANQSTTLNASTSMALSASAPDGTVLSFTAAGLPPGLSINSAWGLISGVASVSGTYQVTVAVSNGVASASRTFTWTVVDAIAPSPLNSGDHDGDGKTDIVLYRTGVWSVLLSSRNFASALTYQWGETTDTPVPADYDGDGKTDLAIYRPSTGVWWILSSSTNFASALTYQWGETTDTPVPADYDGDGKTDLAIYRPSTGVWWILPSSTNFTTPLTYRWGDTADTPVPADYDGDGKTDLAIYRPSTGVWWIIPSSTNFATPLSHQWGNPTDTPVPADYDGDGKTDIAIYRPATGVWWLLLSSTNSSSSGYYDVFYPWGISTDAPAPADYDGDGKADLAVYRPSSGVWWLLLSSANFSRARAIY